MTKDRVFNIVVTIAVIITGTVFGAWAGFVYSQDFWWVGALTGGISAFPLAKLYLVQIRKAIVEDGRKIMICCYGAVLAAVCGIISTIIIHAAMLLTVYFSGYLDEIWPIVVYVGGSIGGAAGLILGMVCTLVYVLVVKGEHSETA